MCLLVSAQKHCPSSPTGDVAPNLTTSLVQKGQKILLDNDKTLWDATKNSQPQFSCTGLDSLKKPTSKPNSLPIRKLNTGTATPFRFASTHPNCHFQNICTAFHHSFTVRWNCRLVIQILLPSKWPPTLALSGLLLFSYALHFFFFVLHGALC
jgi:hypothetical protein